MWWKRIHTAASQIANIKPWRLLENRSQHRYSNRKKDSKCSILRPITRQRASHATFRRLSQTKYSASGAIISMTWQLFPGLKDLKDSNQPKKKDY
jgi:hypothetical protein